MTVYVDKTHKKFKKVTNADSDFITDCLDTLDDLGLAGYSTDSPNGFYNFDSYRLIQDKDARQEFTDELTSLPFKKQAQIYKFLKEKQTGKPFNYYEEYQEFLLDYGENGTPAEVQDDFLSSLRDDAFISDFNEVDRLISIEVFFRGLEKLLTNFEYWYITGYGQGEYTYVWTFDKHNEGLLDLKDYVKTTMLHSVQQCEYKFEDYLQTLIFGTFVIVVDCDRDGNTTEDQEESAEEIADLYIYNDKNPYSSDRNVDEYMEDHYGMKKAKVIVAYA